MKEEKSAKEIDTHAELPASSADENAESKRNKSRRRQVDEDEVFEKYSWNYLQKDTKKDRVAKAVGNIVMWYFIVATVILLLAPLLAVVSLLFLGDTFFDYFFDEVLFDIFIWTAYIGFGAPVFFLWFIGVPVGAIIGMQKVSRWGFIASVPFAIWVPFALPWPLTADFLKEQFSWSLWTFSPPSKPVYYMGLAICIILMLAVPFLIESALRKRRGKQITGREEPLAESDKLAAKADDPAAEAAKEVTAEVTAEVANLEDPYGDPISEQTDHKEEHVEQLRARRENKKWPPTPGQ